MRCLLHSFLHLLFTIVRIQEIFEFAEEMEIDIPHVWKYLGEIIGSTAFDGVLPLQSVNQLASRFVTKKLNGAKLFAQILNTAVDLSVGSV